MSVTRPYSGPVSLVANGLLDFTRFQSASNSSATISGSVVRLVVPISSGWSTIHTVRPDQFRGTLDVRSRVALYRVEVRLRQLVVITYTQHQRACRDDAPCQKSAPTDILIVLMSFSRRAFIAARMR